MYSVWKCQPLHPKTFCKFHSLYGEFKHIQEKANAAIFAARDSGDSDITIARDGKAVTLKEKDLWDEVWNLGSDCEAGKILAEKPTRSSSQLRRKPRRARSKHSRFRSGTSTRSA